MEKTISYGARLRSGVDLSDELIYYKRLAVGFPADFRSTRADGRSETVFIVGEQSRGDSRLFRKAR